MAETAPPAVSEPRNLARELARAYTDAVQYFREQQGLDAEAADAAARAPLSLEQRRRLATCAPDTISWWELAALTGDIPTAAATVWEGLVEEATGELTTGYRAAMAM